MSDPYADIAAPLSAGNDPYADVAATENHTYKLRTKTGKVVTFEAPLGIPDAEIKRLAVKAGADPKVPITIKRDGSGLPKTDTSAGSGFLAGAMKPVDNAARFIADIPGVGAAGDAISRATGLPTTAEAVAANDDWRQNNTRTGYQTLGNIAGTLPLSRLPGGLATQGAASGALLSDRDTAAGVGVDAVLGGAGSVVGGKIAQGLGSLATGVTDKGLKALNAAGVPLTLGQIVSAGQGIVSKAISKGEEALTSVPLLGDIIAVARDRGTQGLNVALGNRILANVGERLGKGVEAGHDLVDAVQQKLSSRYSALVPKLTAKTDQAFAQDLLAAADLADQAGRKGQLGNIVSKVLGNRFNGATIGSQKLKDAESELTRLVGLYKGKQGDEGLFGEALDGVRQGLRGMIQRSNPAHAQELQGLNTAWAQLKAFRNASQAAGNNATGVVTPASALRAFTKGGYRDPLLETAKQVLPNATPDSGTARRAAMTLGTLATGGGVGAATVSPALAAPVALSALYTKPGQKVLNAAAFANRPAAVAKTGTTLKALSRYAPQAVTPLLVGGQE